VILRSLQGGPCVYTRGDTGYQYTIWAIAILAAVVWGGPRVCRFARSVPVDASRFPRDGGADPCDACTVLCDICSGISSRITATLSLSLVVFPDTARSREWGSLATAVPTIDNNPGPRGPDLAVT
jgi:hypothetical protein